MSDFVDRVDPMTVLTLAQQRAIAAALRALPDPSWSDGVRRSVLAQLSGDGPWSNAQINAAVITAFTDLGIVDCPVLPT
jgi:hypothetical protein